MVTYPQSKLISTTFNGVLWSLTDRGTFCLTKFDFKMFKCLSSMFQVKYQASEITLIYIAIAPSFGEWYSIASWNFEKILYCFAIFDISNTWFHLFELLLSCKIWRFFFFSYFWILEFWYLKRAFRVDLRIFFCA